MFTSLARFLRDEDGSTALEYSLVAALMAIVTIGALRALSTNVSNNYSSIAAAVDAAS